MKHLKELRKANNLKQKDLANYLNIPQATYCRIENSKFEADYNVLLKLSKKFNVSINYLIDDDLSEENNQYTKNEFQQIKEIEQLQILSKEIKRIDKQVDNLIKEKFNSKIIGIYNNNGTINQNIMISNNTLETDDEDKKINN